MRYKIADEMYEVEDGTEKVSITRSLADVWQGRSGAAGECMNAKCVLRNAASFPHPVLAVSVIKTVVLVVDRPGHAVRYMLSERDSRLIHEHDTEQVGEPGALTLRVPTGTRRQGAYRDRSQPGKRPSFTGAHRRHLVRGEQARVKAAIAATTADAQEGTA